jgi:hypothetical protein
MVAVATVMQVVRARRRAIGATALAIVVAAVTLFADWHQATVIHARCAQHGELFHVGAGGPRVADHRIAARDGAASDEHDHCELCPRVHDGTPPQPPIIRAPMPPAAPAPVVRPRAIVIATGDAVLRHAPKTSPPIPRSAVS